MTLNSATRRESTDDRRHAIAAAARALIVEKGFEGLRTRDIAQRVGINIATLHYHVPSKEALIGLVAESMRAEFQQQSASRPRAGLPPLRQLRMEFEDFAETMAERPELITLLIELAQRARRDPAIDRVMAPMHAFWMGQFVDIFTSGIADGTFRADLDPLAATVIVTGALTDFWRNTDGVPDTLYRVTRELERAFVSPSLLKD